MRQKKEYDFVVTLKHPDYKIYNIITVLICLITIAAAVFGLLHSFFSTYTWVNVFLIAFIVINLSVAFIKGDKKEAITTFKWSLYASAFLWLLYPLHMPAIAIFYVIAALLERQIKFPQEIGFSNDGLTFNTFPFKNYSWQQVRNAMLKDNMLTLDFVSNKILQKETESDVDKTTEKEFNAYCHMHLPDDGSLLSN
ncbi:MAG: hypothetical protein ABJB05_11650 [Parafilimonas sp.]